MRKRTHTRRWAIGDVQSRWRRLWVMVTVEEAEAEAEAEGVRMEAVGGVRVRVQVQEGTGMVISRQEEVVVAGAGPGTNSGLNRNVARGLVRTVSFLPFFFSSLFLSLVLCFASGFALRCVGAVRLTVMVVFMASTTRVTGRRGKNRCEGDNPCTLHSVSILFNPPQRAC
jgi:hypothetical protein